MQDASTSTLTTAMATTTDARTNTEGGKVTGINKRFSDEG